MKLLFDQNLSPKLVDRLATEFPGSIHVASVGLDRASDVDVWNYAQSNAFVIVSKDADVSDLTVLLGYPPKLIWLRLGNCTTFDIETRLRTDKTILEAALSDPGTGVVELR